MEHGIVGHLRDGLIRLGQRGRIVALHEGIPRRIEQWRRLLLGGQTCWRAGRRGSRLGHHDRLRVIEGTAGDVRSAVVGVVVRPISPGPGNRRKSVTGPVASRPPTHRPLIPRVVPVAVPIPVIPVAAVPIAMRRPDEVVRPVDIEVVADVRTVCDVGPVPNIRTIVDARTILGVQPVVPSGRVGNSRPFANA